VKLYDSVGPNPHLVRMFMAEKGIAIPAQTVDLRGGENRQPEHLKRNPMGQMPTLELDDGSHLAEITAICEYLEEKNPTPLANGFRYAEGLKMFQNRITCVPEAAPGLKKIAADRLQWLDGEIANKQFLCGSRFTLADMMLYCWLDFGAKVGQPLDPANSNIVAWMARVAERPSAKA
jgi:glutathione S-transferase